MCFKRRKSTGIDYINITKILIKNLIILEINKPSAIMMARFKRTKEALSGSGGGSSSISAAMKGHQESDSLAEFGTEELQEFAQAFKVKSGKNLI